MVQTENFHMILPSNSSPDTHPNNRPSDFIVNWENPIQLDPDYKWSVAMTEMSYIYKPSSISRNYAMEITYWKYHKETADLTLGYTRDQVATYRNLSMVQWSLSNVKRQSDYNINPYDFKPYKRSKDLKDDSNLRQFKVQVIQDRFQMVSPYPFVLDFSNCKDPTQTIILLGLEEHVIANSHVALSWCDSQHEGDYMVLGSPNCEYRMIEAMTNLLKEDKEADLTKLISGINLLMYVFHWSISNVTFDEDKRFLSYREMVTFLNDRFSPLYAEFKNDESTNYKLQVKVNPCVGRIRLLNEFNYVLGFGNPLYEDPDWTSRSNMIQFARSKITPKTWYADEAMQLHRGITSLYVYASVCQPIYVGHTQAPLLKNVFIDSSNDANKEGVARNHVVINPMYVPVAQTSFSSIEINIRNDIGVLVPFPQGAITTVTVHFKRENN